MAVLLKKFVASASLLALCSSGAPALAQYYDNPYFSVPIRSYSNPYYGYPSYYGGNPYGYSRRSNRVVKGALTGAAIGAGAGAALGLLSGRRVVKKALVGAGAGAAIGAGVGALSGRNRRYYDYYDY